MARSKVLLVGDRDASLRDLSATLERESDGDVTAEVVARIGDALQRVSAKGYDAVVCWSERLDELTGVLRIRKANPELPIVAVTPQDDPGFKALARQMGATRILEMGASVSSISEMLRLALSTGDLAREVRVQAEGVRSRAEKLFELARINKRLSEEARTHVRKAVRPPLVPLVVEADPDQALLLVRAFQKSGVHVRLPLMRSGEEAVRYLSGAAPFQNRTRFPLPSIVLLNVQLSGMSGLDVLEWIKGQASLRALRVVLLSAALDPDALNRAHEAGADGFLTKPTTFEGLEMLAGLVHGLQDQWGWTRPRE